eukprot:TRINITY_DN21885_c0_g1_i1.p1 TRINITY_DN21885_c0_g1~~TRINITY_DN21885_c0_g1_i1.p1  ORF type:complete len:600 (+),score=145.16 TRINITY_DN21885_c0_g1_i1:63-1802(+)
MAQGAAAEDGSKARRGSNDPGIQLFVRLPDGRTLPLELAASATVKDLADAVRQEAGVKHGIRLRAFGEQLNMAAELADSGVSAQTVLECDWGFDCAALDKVIAAQQRARGHGDPTASPSGQESQSGARHLLLPYSDEDSPNIHKCLVRLRKILSFEDQPPIEPVIRTGVVPILVEHLRPEAPDDIKFEACWAVTNICSGTSEQARVPLEEPELLDHLCAMMDSGSDDLAEQTVWCLGNLAGDCAEFRDKLLAAGVLTRLLAMAERDQLKTTLARNLAWTLSNCVRHKPEPVFDDPTMSRIIRAGSRFMSNPDSEVVSDGAWTMAYLTQIEEPCAHSLILEHGAESECAGIVQIAVQNMLQGTQARHPSLRIIGNLCSGSAEATQACVAKGALPALLSVLRAAHKPDQLKEVLWALSNIAAGTPEQCAAMANTDGLLAAVASTVLERQRHPDMVKEGLYVFSNVLEGGTAEHRAAVFTCGGVRCLLRALSNARGRDKLLPACQDFIKALCTHGGQEMRAIAISSGVVAALRRRASDSERAREVLDEYFADCPADVPENPEEQGESDEEDFGEDGADDNSD